MREFTCSCVCVRACVRVCVCVFASLHVCVHVRMYIVYTMCMMYVYACTCNVQYVYRHVVIMRYLMNSREEVTMRKRTMVMMCPVMPAAVTKQMVIGSCTV